jgi:hypothetical protein
MILSSPLQRARYAKFAGVAVTGAGLLLCGVAGTFSAPAKEARGASARTSLNKSLPSSTGDNPPAPTKLGDAIGTIEGNAIAVSGPMSVEVVNGQAKTVLHSGSDVRVRSGTARINLMEGGTITICGPAHLSVLKAAGALTVALETGTIHAVIEQQPVLTVYTAQIKAQPISIGEATQDLLVGFDNPGAMCVRAARGAVRIEQQLTGQSVVIPQTGDVLLLNGQLDSLRSSTGRCICEADLSAATPAPAPATPNAEATPEVSTLATTEDLRKRTYDAKPLIPSPTSHKPTEKEEPIYQVIEPPLVYLANAKVQPEIDPSMIILVRRVRVRPTVIFQGRVLGEPVMAPATVAAAAVPTSPAAAQPSTPSGATAATPATKKPANPTFTDRVKSFMQKLWPSTP